MKGKGKRPRRKAKGKGKRERRKAEGKRSRRKDEGGRHKAEGARRTRQRRENRAVRRLAAGGEGPEPGAASRLSRRRIPSATRSQRHGRSRIMISPPTIQTIRVSTTSFPCSPGCSAFLQTNTQPVPRAPGAVRANTDVSVGSSTRATTNCISSGAQPAISNPTASPRPLHAPFLDTRRLTLSPNRFPLPWPRLRLRLSLGLFLGLPPSPFPFSLRPFALAFCLFPSTFRLGLFPFPFPPSPSLPSAFRLGLFPFPSAFPLATRSAVPQGSPTTPLADPRCASVFWKSVSPGTTSSHSSRRASDSSAVRPRRPDVGAQVVMVATGGEEERARDSSTPSCPAQVSRGRRPPLPRGCRRAGGRVRCECRRASRSTPLLSPRPPERRRRGLP